MELQENDIILLEHTNEELILKIYNDLCDKHFSSVRYDFDEETQTYSLICAPDEQTDAIRMMLLYIADDHATFLSSAEQEEVRTQLSLEADELLPDEGGKTYVNARERYSDMMSSATSLLFVGVIGLVFVTLVLLHVIPLNMTVLFYILGYGMFAAFVIYGFFSLKKAFVIKAGISDEESLKEQMTQFLLHTYTPLSPEESGADVSEEELYFIRTEHMKNALCDAFDGADELMMDAVIEEVYAEIYP